ncbi:MAG: TIGR00725 family protein [Xenococcaceae cyanobacterium MO_188.B29]|nr:TIGR00725 family protein [Xenococcaceae cyanobacterium MO_188.B29]
MRKTIVGVMGAGNLATPTDLDNAYKLGQLIAQNGWILLTGGRKAGVMEATSKGAKIAGGLTVGILPGNNTDNLADDVDIAIVTDLGNARNNINVLSSDVVIACGMGTGTASEVALALKNQKKVILLTENQESKQFFSSLSPENILIANTPEQAIALVKQIILQHSLTTNQ